jgi:hypothetical protein
MNSDALVEILRINLNTKYYNNEESFLKFDFSTIVIWYLQFIQLLINLNKDKCGNLGFKSESYVYFKK